MHVFVLFEKNANLQTEATKFCEHIMHENKALEFLYTMPPNSLFITEIIHH